MKLYIEFCGVPGSGKTMACSLLFEALKASLPCVLLREQAVTLCLKRKNDGILKNFMKRCPEFVWKRFMSSEYALPELLTFASEHLALFDTAVHSLSKRASSTLWNWDVLNTFIKTFCEYELMSKHLRDDEILVMDEGNSHQCFTLFGYVKEPLPEKEILKYAELIPLPDYVFWADADADQIDERLGERKPPGPFQLRSLSTEQRTAQLEHAARCFGVLNKHLAARGAKVIRIDTSGPKETTAETVQEIASQIVSSVSLS